MRSSHFLLAIVLGALASIPAVPTVATAQIKPGKSEADKAARESARQDFLGRFRKE